MPPEVTHIHFQNDLEYTNEVNVYTFRNFYNGAGVGIGDFNRDGLADLFFSGNQVDNKLYLNQGEFSFLDITEQAGVASQNVWTTGVSIADINGDGWLDIYICKSGDIKGENRHNELFLNRGISGEQDGMKTVRFEEVSKAYGLDDLGLSTHAAFFDYDLDGDLDCYLLNNSFRSIGNYDLIPDQRKVRDESGGNKLLRNDLEKNDAGEVIGGRFTDVSEEAGIYGSAIGFGLGVTIGDVNQDGWPDIYVSNDFFEKDYLYLNQQDGTFRESVDQMLSEISMGSMGADLADVNNDGMPEIFVTEMLPREEGRLKSKAQFENWNKYRANIKNGYHQQFARNVLQMNAGGGKFLEVGRYAGVEATDWSWGALIFDMDNDGWKDIFVANGIFKDLLDQDFINFFSDPAEVRRVLNDPEGGIVKLVDQIPSEPLSNFAFHNDGNMSFTNKAEEWGLGQKSFSNGSAYGDLDNDGDLDLVVNNINMPPVVYRNNSEGHFLQLALSDDSSANRHGIGAKIQVFTGDQVQYLEVFPARGFMSSVDLKAHFGLGTARQVDSVQVTWPDRTVDKLFALPADTLIQLAKGSTTAEAVALAYGLPSVAGPLLVPDVSFNPEFRHREQDYSDFDREALLVQMHSGEGPACCVGDINRDGLSDFYVGGAKDQAGQLFVQNPDGTFRTVDVPAFMNHLSSEDTDCLFFDANGDGADDLYVASGSSEFGPNNANLADRLYFNAGNGELEFSNQILPSFRFENSSAVKALDFDQDGDQDLVVSIFIQPFVYGVPSDMYLLENDGSGQFKNVSKSKAPDFARLGMISDVEVLDFDGDGDTDIVAVGEWMGVRLFVNQNGTFTPHESNELTALSGLWNTVTAADLDQDGRTDLLLGNHGRNSRLTGDPEHPLLMYVNDFDQNGKPEQVIAYTRESGEYPFALRNDLLKQLPYLGKQYPNFESYARQRIQDIFSPEQLSGGLTYKAVEMRSGILWNEGGGRFDFAALPLEAQLSPIYAYYVTDLNGDGNLDVLAGGNQHRMKPEIGINAGSVGLVMLGDGKRDFRALTHQESGLYMDGEIRKIVGLRSGGKRQILFAKNHDQPEILMPNLTTNE
ncbi:hypothetical protein CRP01_25190 [Flavilitoribacter nigricans DSM 23189 = NBRC 102662]|uniref:ASPIC/UnbV domain-containing protein n=2 Tax=Flavilitoribacter TaxID=2762562 RepID=A0A2D0N6W1_FLAN2|nr:hypothetical protein CRP01_25190 [Flavilitoribacter nigricans DSM 23189 = NBRC 102662]